MMPRPRSREQPRSWVVHPRATMRGSSWAISATHEHPSKHSRDPRRRGEAATGEDVLAAARQLRPAVVLMDVRMPGMDGITATGRLFTGADWPVKVIVVTTFDLDEYVCQTARNGRATHRMDTHRAERPPSGRRAAHRRRATHPACRRAGRSQSVADVPRRLWDHAGPRVFAA
jgi:CheY-like chemotaxis protein